MISSNVFTICAVYWSLGRRGYFGVSNIALVKVSCQISRSHVRLKKSLILTQIGRFRTVTPVWIHWWLWNDAQCLKQRCPIVFQGHPSNFKVTRDKKLPILTWIERFQTVTPIWIHPWLWNKGPYYFSRSSIEFQGDTGWKIHKLDQIWARLLGRSQLSNPSDLPC